MHLRVLEKLQPTNRLLAISTTGTIHRYYPNAYREATLAPMLKKYL